MIGNESVATEIAADLYGKVNVSYDHFDPGEDDWISNASFGYDSEMRKNEIAVAKTKVYDTFRTVIQYKFGKVQLAGLYQISEQQNLMGAESENGFVISASYSHDALTFKGQYGQSDITVSGRDSLTLGVDYSLNKNAILYAYYIDQKDDRSGIEVLELGAEIKF